MAARLTGAFAGFVLVAMMLAAGCSASPTPTPTPTPTFNQASSGKTGRVDVSAREAKQLIDSTQNLVVLDVRNPDEYASSHIQGAMLIPAQELQGKLAQVPQGRALLVYCRTGVRSLTASNLLVASGFSMVYNLSGGLQAWSDAGYPTVR
ncbi:rhodanese-like domain-containing protein [Chloroflexota bacterium]